jgi:hypothetical protein
VVWGLFGTEIGLVKALEAVKLKQKKYLHRPQTKVIEFLVATLAGLKQLQEISLAAHPLDKDQVVAEAWGQPAWADYSGVSRTLGRLSWTEAKAIVQVLEQVSHSFVQAEVERLRSQGRRLRLDGDLTGIPVSNTSRSYPNAAFGHMDDEIRLGYQAGVVSLESLSYRRLWLSASHHSGDTVACTQAEALVLAAEARLGLRPWRRTELLQQRLQAFEAQLVLAQQRREKQQQVVSQAQLRLDQAHQQAQQRHREVTELEQRYQLDQRLERPTSRLAQARQRWQAAQKRCQSREKLLHKKQQKLTKTEAQWTELQSQLSQLQCRLSRFEQDNRTNTDPVRLEFRLDAGFGTYENLALLIEMGYEVYTKPYNHQVVRFLKSQLTAQPSWIRVGDNAEMVAWPNLKLKRCPYPMNVALERFYTGKTLKYSALLHFGLEPVTQNLPAWFKDYNGRQLIEAGIKEGKQVFYLHRLKVRSEPAIYLQEQFVIFAANFIRWATHWLAQQPLWTENSLDVRKLGIKRQVQVAAHVSAQVIRDSEGWLLRFNEQSAFAGKVLRLSGRSYLPSFASKSLTFGLFFNESHLIAQPLR